jgi:maltose/moltooligosaccharide transporter
MEPLRVSRIGKDIWHGIMEMHPEAKKLCWVNGLTWFGAQCMFVFLPLFMAHNIFGTHDTGSAAYTASRQLTSSAWLTYYLVVFGASALVGKLSTRYSMKAIHTVGLLCMAFALMGMAFATTPVQAVIAMGIAGVGWATTMAIPFAWAARYSPEGKGGVHLSAFNTYIAFASFIANLVVGALVTATHNDASALMLAGGVALLSAVLLQGVKEAETEPASSAGAELPEAVPAT